MKRMRKALMAAAMAALTALLEGWFASGPDRTDSEIAVMVGGAVSAALVAGLAVYRVRNEGPGIDPATGSEPPGRAVTYGTP